MNSARWTWIAIGYECSFAYAIAFCIYQIASTVAGYGNIIGLVLAIAVIICAAWLLFRPYKESTTLDKTVRVN